MIIVRGMNCLALKQIWLQYHSASELLLNFDYRFLSIQKRVKHISFDDVSVLINSFEFNATSNFLKIELEQKCTTTKILLDRLKQPSKALFEAVFPNWSRVRLFSLEWPWLGFVGFDWSWLGFVGLDWPWLNLISLE